MITIGIIVVTAIVSFAAFKNEELFNKLCLYPYEMHRTKGQLFRFVSVGFVHADAGHLILNMLTLFFFGKELEGTVFSETQYLLFYMSALVLSCLQTYAKQKNNENYKACGASGAVSAVLFALVLYAPWGVVYIKFIIPVYFILYAVGYLIYSYYMSKRMGDNVAHDVHIAGALYGIAFTLITKPESLRVFLNQIQDVPFLN